MTDRVPDDIWKRIVEHSPLVSVDLIVEHDGGVILGKRENEPAYGRWFVPGGVVRKGESLIDAVQRVSRDEIGSEVTIRSQLGVYEHYYETSEFYGVEKHYVPIAFVVQPDYETFEPDGQHTELRTFDPPYSGFHDYIQTYLDDYVAWKSGSTNVSS